MDTSFVNSVDAPSLALIVPILNRGLRDRSPTVKRMAALIAGTMCEFLRDISAALPYTQVLLEDLQRVLVDPIPDVRSAGARALGLLFRGVGEGHFPNLIGRNPTTVLTSLSNECQLQIGCLNSSDQIVRVSSATVVHRFASVLTLLMASPDPIS